MPATSLPVRADAPPTTTMDATRLRQLALECGADDAGVVEIGHPDLDDQRADILAFYPRTKALLAVVCRMNREPIRNLARSVANLEFHATGDDMNDVCRAVVTALERESVPAVNPPMGFPMEADRWPEKMWVVSHKPVAVAAGLGQMGIHRNVIHPKFGSFILLGTILIEAEAFDLASCYTHNYREFMGGFGDWVEHVADAGSGLALRQKVTRQETASVWQSLALGPNYKAAYCLAVCPAGGDMIGPFRADRPGFLNEIVKPL